MTELPAIVDCRPLEKFIQGHLLDACSIPAQDLFTRMHELPMRNVPLTLFGSTADLCMAEAFLSDRNFTIAASIKEDEASIAIAKLENRWESGSDSRQLWRASELIETLLSQHGTKIPAQAVGLDIACGAGRDMVYLAQHGISMHGIDYLEDALLRAQSLAGINNVDIKSYLFDLEKSSNPFAEISDEQQLPCSFDLIHVARYLHRPLLAMLKDLVNPGGLIIYQTFMQGCQQISRPKNPKFLLEQGELRREFSAFTIIQDDIAYLQDKRPISAFIAQKPFA